MVFRFGNLLVFLKLFCRIQYQECEKERFVCRAFGKIMFSYKKKKCNYNFCIACLSTGCQ